MEEAGSCLPSGGDFGGLNLKERGRAPLSLTDSVRYLKGVGPGRALLLEKLGVRTLEEALFLLPRAYEDRSRLVPIRELQPGSFQVFEARVLSAGIRYGGRGRRRIFELALADGTGTISARWFQFRESFLKGRFSPGQRVLVSAPVRRNVRFGGRLEVHHPEVEILDGEENSSAFEGRVLPIYPAAVGLTQKTLRRLITGALEVCLDHIPEILPPGILAKYHLPPRRESLRQIHAPEDIPVDILARRESPAHRRFVFEELFLLQLGLALRRKDNEVSTKAVSLDPPGPLVQRILKALPFSLTRDQERAAAEIFEDMARPVPMNRLLQGEVGSGKTAVALLALAAAVEGGLQGVLMAPTEILAEQHYRTLSSLTSPIGLNLCLLTSEVKRASRERLLRQIAGGEMDIIVGTHALIQEEVEVPNLGVAIIDEQQRFGVLQRAKLRKKGVNPDVLVMTATPIPRTLSLTVYGDLDISVLKELPRGRPPIETRVLAAARAPEAYGLIRREVAAGRQAFVICPLVEESEKLDLQAATETAFRLQGEVFPDLKVGLLHGRMRAEEKDAVMRALTAGALQILVCTSVVEVGIDVPNATVMVVEHAERFGLAQLHQMRGRVGRGTEPSYCVLLAHPPLSSEARQRLEAIVSSRDGFALAEKDLLIRGPGEFLGTRQSGIPELLLADLLRDQDVLLSARREAFRLVSADPGLQKPAHRELRQALQRRWGERLDLVKTG